MATEPGGVMVAHKDPLARAYVGGLVERDLTLGHCVEAEDFGGLLTALRDSAAITLAIVDAELPGMAWDVGLRYLTAHHRALRVAVLFTSVPRDAIESLVGQGVAGFVPKHLPERSLVEALRLVAGGSTYLPLAAADPDSSGPAGPAQLDLLDQELTGRQREVLRLLSLGHSNREIAQMLGIAEGTVKVHVNAAFRVLGVHNRVSAAAALRSHGDSHDG